jgi:tRNA-dihydrouridine synthase B
MSKATTQLGPKGLPIAYFIRDIRIEPAVVLAPMEGVSNIVFRRLIREIGGCGLTYTEFIASKALRARSQRALLMAQFDPDELPIAIQIFGRDPEEMAEAAKVIEGLGASILDINMGCPSKKVCAHSGGSALMREPDLATEIVKKVRAAISIPLTVKMRSGFDASCRNAPELAYRFQEEGVEALTIHWRTREDGYRGVRAIDKIAESKARVHIPVIANGDVTDAESALAILRETGADGVMVGRGAMRNPWSLLHISQAFSGAPPIEVNRESKHQLLLAFLLKHHENLQSEIATLGKFKQIAKYFCSELEGGEEFRRNVLRAQSMNEILALIEDFFKAPLPPSMASLPYTRSSCPVPD